MFVMQFNLCFCAVCDQTWLSEILLLGAQVVPTSVLSAEINPRQDDKAGLFLQVSAHLLKTSSFLLYPRCAAIARLPSDSRPQGREKHLLSGSPEGYWACLLIPLTAPSLWYLLEANLYLCSQTRQSPRCPTSDWNTSCELKLSRRERAERESEACGICLTGTCLYRPVPFQFKRPLSWEQQLNIILCEERRKKHKTLLSLSPSRRAAFRTGPADPSRTLCCKCFIIWLNFNYFPGLLSPIATALSAHCEGKGSQVTKVWREDQGDGGRWQNISLASEMLAHMNIQSWLATDDAWVGVWLRGPRFCSHLLDKLFDERQIPAVSKRPRCSQLSFNQLFDSLLNTGRVRIQQTCVGNESRWAATAGD